MGIKKPRSLRKAINAHCRSCIYDSQAAGSWLAQVSLCPCTDCELHEVRPTTTLIADSVYDYYGETSHQSLKNAQNEPFSDETDKPGTGGLRRE